MAIPQINTEGERNMAVSTERFAKLNKLGIRDRILEAKTWEELCTTDASWVGAGQLLEKIRQSKICQDSGIIVSGGQYGYSRKVDPNLSDAEKLKKLKEAANSPGAVARALAAAKGAAKTKAEKEKVEKERKRIEDKAKREAEKARKEAERIQEEARIAEEKAPKVLLEIQQHLKIKGNIFTRSHSGEYSDDKKIKAVGEKSEDGLALGLAIDCGYYWVKIEDLRPMVNVGVEAKKLVPSGSGMKINYSVKVPYLGSQTYNPDTGWEEGLVEKNGNGLLFKPDKNDRNDGYAVKFLNETLELLFKFLDREFEIVEKTGPKQVVKA